MLEATLLDRSDDKAGSGCRNRCKKYDVWPGPLFLNPIPLVVIMLYLLVGTVMYTLVVPLEGPLPHTNVTWIDAAYFSLVTLTTVGYGDFHPAPNDIWCRLFTIVYAILGVSFVGWALGSIAENAIQKVATRATLKPEEQKESAFSGRCRRCGPCGQCWLNMLPVWRNLVITFAVMTVLLVVGVVVFVLTDGMTILEGTYYVVISATTIGYGDDSPKTPASKIFAIFWLMMVTAWLAKCIDDVLSVSSERSLNNLREKLLSRNLECSDLADVDLNGDGKISRYEFLRHHLIAGSWGVEEADIDLIMDSFDRQDKDHDDDIDIDDIITK